MSFKTLLAIVVLVGVLWFLGVVGWVASKVPG